MIEAFEALREQFRTFGTDGISMVLVCTAMLFCVAARDRMEEGARRLTGYGVLFFILLANPFGYHIIHDFWLKEYWKIFMVLLPVVFVAIAVTELILNSKSFWKGAVTALCCVGIFAASAFFKVDFSRVAVLSEARETETEAAAVDEMIRAADIVPENMIAPREICAQIRESNPGVKLLFGEALMEGILNDTVTAENEEERQFIDDCRTFIAVPDAVDYQLVVAERYESNCILLKEAYDSPEQMEDAGFYCHGRTENYAVYFKE
ncbi:MAG: hypothetical protein J6K53_11970 [Roseburia sp.]|nr:hypothetical protein [Roseburia sp.]